MLGFEEAVVRAVGGALDLGAEETELGRLPSRVRPPARGRHRNRLRELASREAIVELALVNGIAFGSKNSALVARAGPAVRA